MAASKHIQNAKYEFRFSITLAGKYKLHLRHVHDERTEVDNVVKLEDVLAFILSATSLSR